MAGHAANDAFYRYMANNTHHIDTLVKFASDNAWALDTDASFIVFILCSEDYFIEAYVVHLGLYDSLMQVRYLVLTEVSFQPGARQLSFRYIDAECAWAVAILRVASGN